MFTSRLNFNGKLSAVREKTEKFFYGYFYPVYLALAVLLFWVMDLQLLGFIIALLTACFILFAFDDFTPIVPVLFILPMSFRNSVELFSSVQSAIPCIICFAFFALALVAHFIIYPVKKLRVDKFFFACVGLFIVLFLGGLGTTFLNNFSSGLANLFIAGLVPAVIHFLLINTIKPNDKINLRKYFCFCFLTAINLACLQLLYATAHVKINGYVEFLFPGFCWANVNHIANLIIIAVPVCCYLMTDAKKLRYGILELLFLYASIVFTASEGSIAVLLGFTPVIMFFLIKNVNKQNYKPLKFFYALLITGAVLVVGYLVAFKFDFLTELLAKASVDNRRSIAYNSAIDRFMENPVFGAGYGYGSYKLSLYDDNFFRGYYHSTFFHVLACAGSVGILAYALYYVARLKLITANNTVLGNFILLSFVIFAVYGIIENSEVNIILIYMTTMISLCGITNKSGNDDLPLPLSLRFYKLKF